MALQVGTSPKKVMENLFGSTLFQDWQQQHPKAFLSHFFCPLTADFAAKTGWEVGYFDAGTKKITVFAELGNADFSIKPEDDVFKKEMDKIEELVMGNVRLTLEQAAERCKEKLPEFFPKEQLGDGFVVLQTLQGKALWNFSFITRTLKFANVKIDASNGRIESHQEIELVRK